jgi:hypothetical protein
MCAASSIPCRIALRSVLLAGPCLAAWLLLHPQVAQAADPKPQSAPPNQIGLTVGMPFFDDTKIHTDMSFDLRYGRKFSWIVPYVSGGFRQVRLDPALIPDEARNKKLQAWHLTVGVRVEIPLIAGKLYPFIGVAGELALWSYTFDTNAWCHEDWYPGEWRCYNKLDWKSGGAVKRQVGIVYTPQPAMAVEIWFEQATMQSPGMFHRLVRSVTPNIGVAWRF